MSLLLNSKFKDERLVTAVIYANIKPLTMSGYYMTEQEFENSMYSKKNKNNNFKDEQTFCHHVYIDLYGGENPNLFLQKILTQLLPAYCRAQEED